MLLAAASVVSCGGHSESWQFGYDNADSAVRKVSLGVAEETACRSISGIGDRDRNEVVQGCLAALDEASG